MTATVRPLAEFVLRVCGFHRGPLTLQYCALARAVNGSRVKLAGDSERALHAWHLEPVSFCEFTTDSRATAQSWSDSDAMEM